MKNLIVFLTAIIVFSSSAKAFDQWCPQSSEINYRATMAVDNLEFLEEEVRFFNSYRRRIINQSNQQSNEQNNISTGKTIKKKKSVTKNKTENTPKKKKHGYLFLYVHATPKYMFFYV